ncbi:MAG: nicotinate-nucleotide diphosphorylase (carboxylating), partial [Chloroflexi bacterium]|nr:nicotinate-nucleotide diphosphorylase (carboxylating) [Chloroflexota bacterium]
MLELCWTQVAEIVDRALAEDSSWGDVTTQAIIPTDSMGKATVVVKADGVLAG